MTATEPRCPRCKERLVRLHGGLLDGVLTCGSGCELREEHFPPGELFLVELWYTVERRRNLKRLIAEKQRLGLPPAISVQEAGRAWNGAVRVTGGRAVRGLDFEDEQ